MKRNLDNANWESLNKTVQQQIDNFILSIHIEFVKNNNLKGTISNIYQYVYDKVYQHIKESINSVDWETIKPRIQSIIHETIKYLKI